LAGDAQQDYQYLTRQKTEKSIHKDERPSAAISKKWSAALHCKKAQKVTPLMRLWRIINVTQQTALPRRNGSLPSACCCCCIPSKQPTAARSHREIDWGN
jgi:hypothetical protein